MYRYLLLAITMIFMSNTSVWAVAFSADMVTKAIIQEKSKIHYQNADTFRTEAMGIINIVNAPMTYQLVPATKKYTAQKLEEVKENSPMGSYGDMKTFIEKNKMKKTGKETLQGYKCIIYEGSVKFSEQHPPAPMKIWYAKKLDNMIKQEVSMGPPMGSVVNALENIKIGKQDPSLFELPEGYVKVDSLEQAMGMGSFQMPSMGSGEGKMPSPEEMEKMMQQMQEMMKQQ